MAFVFSYNPSDPDILTAPSSSRQQLTSTVTSRPRTGLGAYAERRWNDGEDDDVPVYGPTTHRRGKLRFVPASDGGLGVLPGTVGELGEVYEAVEGKGKGRATDHDDLRAKEEERDEEEKKRRTATLVKPSGSAVKGLYESIVGMKSASTSARASPAPAQEEPPDPGPSTFSAFSSPASTLQPKSAPLPRPSSPRRPPPAPTREADIVLSSDTEPEPDDDPDFALPPVDDDDLIVLDPLTGMPEPSALPSRRSTTSRRPASSSSSASRTFSHRPPPPDVRVQPLLSHQLLPSSASEPPPELPVHYAIKEDNVGRQMLAKLGWKEGSTLGPRPLPSSASSSTRSAADPPSAPSPHAAEQPRGLKVPLRAIEKHDRLGLGSSGTTKEGWRRLTPRERELEQKMKEYEERKERERRGRGARGMAAVKKREERERKEMLGYMNR
ncbi:hypothetical protein JCM8097_009097 [Rhodosporidiobolus ruineniae]